MTAFSSAESTSPSRDHIAPDTHQKALAVNLDATSFGSFAQIGAGQEVARWFLQVGAASGTVAKTASAYDEVVSARHRPCAIFMNTCSPRAFSLRCLQRNNLRD